MIRSRTVGEGARCSVRFKQTGLQEVAVTTTENDAPEPPTGTGAAGRRLWASVTTDYDLDEHERAVLVEATRTVDVLDELDAAIRSEGAIVDSPQGRRANPAAVEARQQRVVLARLLAALRMPVGEAGDEPANARPRRRGPRGVYGVRRVS